MMSKLKKYFLLLFIFFANVMFLGALDSFFGFHTFSYSAETTEEERINNFSFGHEFMIGTPMFLHFIGLNYKFYGRGHSLNLYSMLTPGLIRRLNIVIPFGFGANIAYNFTQNVFCISPQVDLVLFAHILKFNITYRYNIYIGIDGSHELELKIGIMDFFSLRKVSA